MKKAYLDTPAGQIHYQIDGSGEPLLLLHKTSLSSDEYSEVMPLLSKAYRVMALDTPGYGKSDKPSRVYRIEDYAQRVIDFLGFLGIKRTVLAGHLTGASIAVEVAAFHPELIDKLVLISCPYYDSEVLQARLRAYHFGVEEIREDGSHLTELWNRYRETMPTAKPENLQRTILGYLMAGPGAHDGHQAVFRYPVESRLPSIQCPTLLISGGRYDIFHSRLQVTKDLISRCRMEIIEGGGDLVPLERPDELVRVVLDFLAQPGV